MDWQLQDAKSSFYQVVREARVSGPQVIIVQGKEVAVVLSADEYKRLIRQKGSLSDFFQSSPLVGSNLNLERDQDPGRDIEL